MAKKPKVVELEMTCNACPSQWEGKTKSGRDVYIRYRYGILAVSLDGEYIYTKGYGGDLDGVMDTNEMQRKLKKVLRFQ